MITRTRMPVVPAKILWQTVDLTEFQLGAPDMLVAANRSRFKQIDLRGGVWWGVVKHGEVKRDEVR